MHKQTKVTRVTINIIELIIRGIKMNIKKYQKILFGIIVDPLSYVVPSYIVLSKNISLITEVNKSEAVLHTVIGLLLVTVFRTILFNKQDWLKLNAFGLFQLLMAGALTSVCHYFLQNFIGIQVIPFIHAVVLNLVSLLIAFVFRMLYVLYYSKSSSDRLLLSSPTTYVEEQKYINEAFEKNWVAPLGFNCDGFENEMVDYLKEDLYAFATVSGTSAIHLAIKLAGVKPGDYVLCSDLTFAATVNPITYEGGIPVFVDSEYDTWNMDPVVLDKAFEKYPSAKVVVLAHLYGTPAKMDEILEVCKKHNVVLVEDAAEALSAKYKDKCCGTFGKYNIFSFNGNKIITTSGGGMLLTNNKKDRDKALFWSTQARENAPWYEHEEIGYNYRMSNVIAGIGRGQLKHLNNHKDLKTKIYMHYKEGFKNLPVQMNPYLSFSSPNFWLSCLLINKENMCNCKRQETSYKYVHEDGKTCPDEIADVLKKNNIETRPIWKPMHMQPVYKNNDFITINNVSEDIFARGICLPSDIKMTKEEQNRVIEIIRDCFE